MCQGKSAEMSLDSLARTFPNKTARPFISVQCVSSPHTLQPQPTAVRADIVTRAALTIPGVLHHSQPTVGGGGDNHQGIAGIYQHYHHHHSHSNNNAIKVLFIVFIIYFSPSTIECSAQFSVNEDIIKFHLTPE